MRQREFIDMLQFGGTGFVKFEQMTGAWNIREPFASKAIAIPPPKTLPIGGYTREARQNAAPSETFCSAK
jgi:hypothetical protein